MWVSIDKCSVFYIHKIYIAQYKYEEDKNTF